MSYSFTRSDTAVCAAAGAVQAKRTRARHQCIAAIVGAHQDPAYPYNRRVPELPEVETVARQLAPLLTGRIITRVDLLDPLLKKRSVPRLEGRAIEAVRRLGKQVLFSFSGAPLHLAVHLRMTGRLIYEPDVKPSTPSHLRARFSFDRGRLHFIDTRRFGTFTWAADLVQLTPVGLDPFSTEFTPLALARLVAKSPTALKVWLLRQDKLVGVGNIYASEICYVARLSPFRAAGSLRRAEIEALYEATLAVLSRAIDNSGTTFSDFQDAYGLTGSYQRYLGVYERAGEPCQRCNTPIKRRTQAQRSTYWCPGCIARAR